MTVTTLANREVTLNMTMNARTTNRGKGRRSSVFCFLLLSSLAIESTPFSVEPNTSSGGGLRTPSSTKATIASDAVPEEPFQVRLNEFFKQPVPKIIRQSVSLFNEQTPEKDPDVVTMLTAAPSVPGSPRPLWLVLLGSLPTGLLWYGYYKFAVEEELLQMELEKGQEPRGFGGYGTLGPFSYGMLLGPLAALLHVPGELNWSAVGVIFIYYTQFLLYDRVNELYTDQGREAPLQVWWCLPIFFPFNLIVGLRQVHFLSQFLYEKRGVSPPPNDPVADFFPFIKAENLTWQEFCLTPSLWCSALADTKSFDKTNLPSAVRDLFSK